MASVLGRLAILGGASAPVLGLQQPLGLWAAGHRPVPTTNWLQAPRETKCACVSPEPCVSVLLAGRSWPVNTLSWPRHLRFCRPRVLRPGASGLVPASRRAQTPGSVPKPTSHEFTPAGCDWDTLCIWEILRCC